jgi:hypothetical protein
LKSLDLYGILLAATRVFWTPDGHSDGRTPVTNALGHLSQARGVANGQTAETISRLPALSTPKWQMG